jgi:hypothetical protein
MNDDTVYLQNTIDELKILVLQLEVNHQEDKNRYHQLHAESMGQIDLLYQLWIVVYR